MPDTSPIPLTYAQWRECITQKCRIKLTRAYLEERIASLGDPEAPQTRGFRDLYGEAHYQDVRRWFQRALAELPPELN